MQNQSSDEPDDEGTAANSNRAPAIEPRPMLDEANTKMEMSDAGLREGATPRYSRRLSDKILISFHQACDQNDFDVAQQLLNVYEFMLTRREMPADLNRRRSLDSLVAAHERLWHLRHPERR